MKFKLLTSSILILGSAYMTEAYAQCTPKAGFTTTDVDMTLGRVVVRPSDPVGTVLKKAAIPYDRNPTTIYQCSNASSETFYGKLVQNFPLSSLGNNIYSTNIPGIGIRLSRTNLTSGITTYYPYELTMDSHNWILSSGIFNIEIIKTENITGSGAISPGQYTTWYAAGNASHPFLTTSLHANAITIASSSCEIQGALNKIVKLPSVTKSDFNGVGSTAGEQNFDINLLCNGGSNPTDLQESNKISLSFDFNANPDLQSIINSYQSTNKASGVSTQLINKYKNANTVITKGSKYLLGSVNSNQSVTYNVPLSARYIQTAQTITPGKVQGLATVTIEYD